MRDLVAEETMNFALVALFNILFAGVTFILYGLAVASSNVYPRWLGWPVVVAGIGSIAVGIVQAQVGESPASAGWPRSCSPRSSPYGWPRSACSFFVELPGSTRVHRTQIRPARAGRRDILNKARPRNTPELVSPYPGAEQTRCGTRLGQHVA